MLRRKENRRDRERWFLSHSGVSCQGIARGVRVFCKSFPLRDNMTQMALIMLYYATVWGLSGEQDKISK